MKTLVTALVIYGFTLVLGMAEESDIKADKKKVKEFHITLQETIKPGESLKGTLRIDLPEGWHTYSDPPGDSGMPPKIDFTLPQGWKAVRGPLPKAKTFKDAAGVTFGYEDKLIIPFTLTASEQLKPGTTALITVSAQWLICKDVCLPREEKVQLKLNVINQEKKDKK